FEQRPARIWSMSSALSEAGPYRRAPTNAVTAVFDVACDFASGQSRPVVLAIRDRQILARHPLQRPARRPRARVRAGIIDRNVVLQRIEVGARESFDQVKLLGVGKAAVAEPEFLIEARRIDDERFPVPSSSCIAVIKRIRIVATELASLRPSIRVNEMPIVIAAAGHDENPAEPLIL